MTKAEKIKLLDDTLAAVNALRAGRGLLPLSALPRGDRGEGCSCPLARALGGTVSPNVEDKWFWRLPDEPKIALPGVLVRFANHFDRGHFPELERHVV